MADESFRNGREECDDNADAMRSPFGEEEVVSAREGVVEVARDKDSGEVVRSARDQPSIRTEYKPDPGFDDTLGKLDWEVTETATGRILGAGKRPFRLEETSSTLIENAEMVLLETKLELNDLFTFGLATEITVGRDPVGFALIGSHTETESFSWDWFEASGAGSATKLQESGEIQHRIEERGGRRQVVYTEFLTDVSVRVQKPGKIRNEPDWRILIRQGSYLAWPMLIDGKIRLIG